MVDAVPASEDHAGSDTYALGVQLIHGIGGQRQGDTLVQWGDKILQAVELGTRGAWIGHVATSSLAQLEPGGTAVAAVRFYCPATDESQSWLLTEAWWAERFTTPSYAH